MKIAIGCDPNAEEAKQEIIAYIEKKGYGEVTDFGSEDPIYANVAIDVAEHVASGEYDRGVLICGTGLGVSIAANKVKGAYGFKTLLCIGETAEQKEYGISAETLRSQLKIGFYGVSPEECKNIWVAYEPVWSIGVNGTPASADYAEAMHKEIKTALYEIFGEKSEEIPVLYGGSVNPGNAESLIVQPSIDGLFVGRAAWDADKFDTLIRDAMKVYAEHNC